MSLEEELQEQMLHMYRRTGKETGYWANYFNRDVQTKGGLQVAKELLSRRSDGSTGKGLQTLIDHGRADLSLEALVLDPRFSPLFTPAELAEARSRLDAIPAHGFRRRLAPSDITIEDMDNQREYLEGAVVQIRVNAYERNSAARDACLQKHGYRCSVCKMLFSEVYGPIGEGFIHVHHRKPLAAIREEYRLDPLKDLVPVCPNCHAMLHSHNPPLSVDELIALMNDQSNA